VRERLLAAIEAEITDSAAVVEAVEV
jgi:hypothetical protein